MHTVSAILAFALCATCAMAMDQTEPLRAVANSAENFATSFVKTVAKANKGKNMISSPLSAHVVLSMAALGAGGKTAMEMRQVLHMPQDDAVSKQGFQNLVDALNNVENVTLEMANKMYVAENLKLKPEFKQLTTGSFRSEASQFKADQPAESANLINGWVKEKTHDKIKEIVKADDVTPDSRMFLLNAVYFKGKWANQFKKESTQEKTFHLDEKNEKKVPTMFTVGDYVYGELPDLKARFIELPYENKDLKMVIIVPDEINGLSNILENLEKFNHTRLSESGYTREVQLYLPKFKIETTLDLQGPLTNMGMGEMFSNAANFSGIAVEDLKVGKVRQKAYIEVNEEGSEAAAVTATKIQLLSFIPQPELAVDRPFLFSIVDKRTSVVLFNGQVVQPKSE